MPVVRDPVLPTVRCPGLSDKRWVECAAGKIESTVQARFEGRVGEVPRRFSRPGLELIVESERVFSASGLCMIEIQQSIPLKNRPKGTSRADRSRPGGKNEIRRWPCRRGTGVPDRS